VLIPRATVCKTTEVNSELEERTSSVKAEEDYRLTRRFTAKGVCFFYFLHEYRVNSGYRLLSTFRRSDYPLARKGNVVPVLN
jgi:hypothetical protein